MRIPSRTHDGPRLGSAAALAGVILLTAACASTPLPPTRSLDAARTAVSNAEKGEAGRYAQPEMSAARDKLAAADVAAARENMVAAERLSEEARVDAELAVAKTAAAKADAVNKQMRVGSEALSDEMQRAGEQR